MSGSARARRVGWLAIAVVTAALLAVGVARAGEPRTADERELSIAKRLACPVCDGESVAESNADSARQIRGQVAELVAAGQLDDDAIVQRIDASYQDELALTPSGSGVDVLAWVLPAVAAALAGAGLATAFARWRRASVPTVSAADRELVAQALNARDSGDSRGSG